MSAIRPAEIDTGPLPHPPRLMLRMLRPLARVYTRRRYAVVVHHADRVPTSGPVIMAANHVGWLDGPMLTLYTPRPVHALTKQEMFVGRMDALLRRAGQISVDRFNPDPAAMKTCVRVLEDDGVIGIFPEGSRGSGELALFKGGAAYLALVSGAPVVPVSLFGTREPGQDSHSRPARGAPPVEIVFGEPWRIEARAWPRTKQDVGEASASLRSHMLQALADAKQLTGRTLPGPLPAGDSERDVAAKQAMT